MTGKSERELRDEELEDALWFFENHLAKTSAPDYGRGYMPVIRAYIERLKADKRRAFEAGREGISPAAQWDLNYESFEDWEKENG